MGGALAPVADLSLGIWGAMVCPLAREIGAEPRFLSLALAQAFLQTEQPTLTPDLPRDISCFRLLLPKSTLFSEEGPEIRSVVVAEVRAMEGWLPDNFELAGGGLACIGLGEDGSTYLASNVLNPAAKAQQPAHTDFSPAVWEWDGDGVRGTADRMEQLCVHALLAQLYAPQLVSEGEIPPAPGAKGFGGSSKKASPASDDVKPPVWLGMVPAAAPARRRRHGGWLAAGPLASALAAGRAGRGSDGVGGAGAGGLRHHQQPDCPAFSIRPLAFTPFRQRPRGSA